jgi:hypothetical protein
MDKVLQQAPIQHLDPRKQHVVGAAHRPAHLLAFRKSAVEAVSGFAVQRVASGQDVRVLTRMALGRADVSDPAVPVLMVVPMNEARSPSAGLGQAGEA